MKGFKFIYLAGLFLLSCNPEKVDTQGIKEEMESFKIKKISQGEIMQQAEKTGSEIYDLFQNKVVSTKLDSTLESGNFEEALKICNYNFNPEKSEIEQSFQSKIFRAGLPSKLRNPTNQPDSLQAMILEGYQYNKEKGLGYFNDVQIQEQEIVYSQPVLLDRESCLKCHGNPETEITADNYKKILALYPKDRSVNFKKGDLMGVFTVRMNKEELIRSIK